MTQPQSHMIRAGIIGGAGYTGGEMIRLLLNHPQTNIVFVHSKSHAGLPLHQVHRDLLAATDMTFTDTLRDDIDVLFLCVGHGEARQFLAANTIPTGTRLIDLSQDFRPHTTNSLSARTFCYGLPELNRDAIRLSDSIANPGCFATAIQLALLPLAAAGLLNETHVTGITGSTGAGQGFSATSHFSWRANNIQAYKTLDHQHLGEICQSLHQLQPSFPAAPGEGWLSFVPWRGDFARGIYTSSVVKTDLPADTLEDHYREYYSTHPFTTISPVMIDLKQVVNTNHCFIHLEKKGKQLAIHSAIDNLLKGAVGQALQNMNLAFGIPETTGLQLKAGYF